MVTWIVEQHDEDQEELTKVLNAKGIPNFVKKFSPLNPLGGISLDEPSAIIVHGTIEFVRSYMKIPDLFPCAWYSPKAFDCSSYYHALAGYIFNSDHIYLPFSEVKHSLPIIKKLGHSVFIRPNSGLKTLSTLCYDTNDVLFQHKWEGMASMYTGNPDSLVLISGNKSISREWRFFVIDGIVSTGSQYMDGNDVEIVSIEESVRGSDAMAYAEKVAQHLKATRNQPAAVYTLDVCLHGGDFYVMELNCFNMSGLYACDKDKLVDDVGAFAEKEWQDYHS